jgi:hypothetical protein
MRALNSSDRRLEPRILPAPPQLPADRSDRAARPARGPMPDASRCARCRRDRHAYRPLPRAAPPLGVGRGNTWQHPRSLNIMGERDCHLVDDLIEGCRTRHQSQAHIPGHVADEWSAYKRCTGRAARAPIKVGTCTTTGSPVRVAIVASTSAIRSRQLCAPPRPIRSHIIDSGWRGRRHRPRVRPACSGVIPTGCRYPFRPPPRAGMRGAAPPLGSGTGFGGQRRS